MSKFRFTLNIMAVTLLTLTVTSLAQAQATRTWVSGVGDDVNPCSRTAPCKTYAGAISKTAAGGEISTLDPGGFGAVTITKSITINGTKGAGFGSILHSGTNGVNVNDSASGAPNSIIVTLRDLNINGAGTTTGLRGISMTSGRNLYVEDCQIEGSKSAPGNGIDVNLNGAPSNGVAQRIHIRNTLIRDISGSGVRVTQANAVGATVMLENVQVSTANNGFTIGTNTKGLAFNSSFASNTQSGVEVLAGAIGAELHDCVMVTNNNGLTLAAGTTRISGCTITNNINGVNFTGGTLVTYGDNKTLGNISNEAIGGSIPAPVGKK
jgi:hypothetical protein